MSPMVFLLTLLGVGYVTALLMRFIVWLDGADEREADLAESAEPEAEAGIGERRSAA